MGAVHGRIATVADVWWNGAHVLATSDMYLAHEIRSR